MAVGMVNVKSAGGGGIKSIQRGTFDVGSIGFGKTDATITFNEIDTAKSIYIITGFGAYSSSAYGVSVIEFNNTYMTIQRQQSSASGVISWQVIEFA